MAEQAWFNVTRIDLSHEGFDVTLDVTIIEAAVLLRDFLDDELGCFSWEEHEFFVEKLKASDGEFVATLRSERLIATELAEAVRSGLRIAMSPVGGLEIHPEVAAATLAYANRTD